MAKKKPQKAKRSRTMIRLGIFTEIILVLFLVIVICWNKGIKDWFTRDWFAGFNNPALHAVVLDDINSSHGVLLQVKGVKVLGDKKMNEEIYPASLTKIMTTILALEQIKNPDHMITLTDEMFDGLYSRDATQAGFQSGENVRAIDLLYGAMLPSGAECCMGLAYDIAGSEEAFVELMNQKAEKLGMKNTHFCNTTGLHNPDHYTTAYDLAILLRYALRNKTFREIAESPWHSTPGTNVHSGGITYYSTLFNGIGDPYVNGGRILGGKTGYTNEAGLCLATYGEVEGREYILVTTGAWTNGEQYEDARMIYNRIGDLVQYLKSQKAK